MGITFGSIQMVLYGIYRKNKPINDQKLPEHKDDIIMNENQMQVVVIPHQINVVDIETHGEKQVEEKKQEKAEPKEEGIQLQQQKEG